MKFRSPFLIAGLIAVMFTACQSNDKQNNPADAIHNAPDTTGSRMQIDTMLDAFNKAAADADFDTYFDFFAPQGVFMGTDATEHWDKEAYKIWAKPFFDKKKTWNFHAVDRHIYIAKNGDMAWFDELLDAPFAVICRGSGVVVRINDGWKIEQYVLSMTVPNAVGDTIRAMKAPIEDTLLLKLKGKQTSK